MKAIEIQAPKPVHKPEGYKTIFLGGSIEMGKAEDWQKKIIETLKHLPFVFFNPRRDDWDSSWEQNKSNPQFREQVLWELNSMEIADIIVMYFDPNTLSPISMLEVGLHATSNKLIVYCPEPFWRKGNIDITSELYGYKIVDSFEELIQAIKEKC